jgi:iron complex transport system substrate-binding protein
VIPSSTSIEGIKEDILFIAAVMGVNAEGEEIIAEMEREIDAIRAIGNAITNKRTVYFEISPAPWMFSFGSNTFLNEMIELLGATNIFADQNGWIPVSEEVLLELDPDVILTSTDFIPDPIGEIKGRPGFDALTAVQNGDVFTINTAASNRPSHNITRAMKEIAEAVFPEYFR